MSDPSKEIDEKIKSMKVEDLFKSTPEETKNKPNKPKESIIKTLALWPFRFIKALMRIDTSSTGSYGAPSSSRYDVPTPPPAQGNGIRDIYRFDPEKEYIRRTEAEGYWRAVDGKGDPKPPCDCDHDHDDR